MIRNVEKIHLIGIGGAAMSGIAEILVSLGYRVTGSDLHENEAVRKLRRDGIRISLKHRAANVAGADVVVYSSAVSRTNPEMVRARERRIPLIRRADMQGELMRMKHGIGIAGTHGKTSTTSMVGAVLIEAGLDPTIMVGGRLQGRRSYAHLGQGKHIVVEADEYDHTFLKLYPVQAVITTLEAEHLDCYTDLDDIKDAFVEYASHVPFYGSVILCLDEKSVQDIIPRIERNIVTYGFSPQAELRAEDISFDRMESVFSVHFKGKKMGSLALRVPGVHNIKNALAAVAVGLELGIGFRTIKKALESFSGVKRRFEIKGRRPNGALVVDDYAHHPTEIDATLSSARKGWEHRRIVAVFQPHLFSRTRDFCELFARAFLKADMLVVADIYPAREKPVPGVTGNMIAEQAVAYGHRDVHFIPKTADILAFLRKHSTGDDIIITLGAGDIWKVGERLVRKNRKK